AEKELQAGVIPLLASEGGEYRLIPICSQCGRSSCASWTAPTKNPLHSPVEDNVKRRSKIRGHIGRLSALVGLLLSFTFGSTALFAQTVSTAQITGTVKDQSGAVLPGAEIKATQTATGAVRTVISAEDGGYVLTNLPIGPYTVEVSLPGFRTYVQAGIV